MTFESPEWFLLLPALLLLALVVKRVHLFTPLRILILALLTTLMAKPAYDSLDQHLDLWVLLDRSDSTEDLVNQGLPEWKKILEKSKPTKDDRILYVDYASDVSIQQANSERATYTGSRKLTRTQLALEDVLARRDANRPSRIVIFTDGYATEPLHEVANKLSEQGIPVDFRLISENSFEDFRVARIDLPTQSQVGEPFLFGVTVKGYRDGEVPITLYRNNTAIETSSVTLTNGVGKVEFTTRIQKAGSYKYSAKIAPADDAHAGNNTSERWIQITGGPRVLLVTNYDNDPLEKVLQAQSYAVDIVTDSESLTIGQLSGTKSVIFNNVPAHEVPTQFLDALSFYITEQGGGFMMVGGKRSFAAGGYYQSPIDPLLPISMELKNDHRKLSVAMSIVMDRSGSMAMSVPGAGGGVVTKMELANTGASEAIKLLGANDQIAVYAVDSEPTTIIPLQTIGANKGALTKKTRKIISAGGGIYVYNGLKAAWDDLKKSKISTKHIILFSDASDTEEPGDYKKLIAEMQREGATISVIGLGTNKDPDAALLEDIAKRGKGRMFYTEKAVDIPQLFAQETVTLARSAFLTDPVGALATGQWNDVSNEPLEWSPQVDAYNLSYARPKAITSLLSKDEYVAPLVTHWRRGMGRVAAVAFPLGGEHSEIVRNWDAYGNFSQTLINWLNGDRFPPGITMRHRLEGTRLTIDLLYDTTSDGHNWTKEFALNPPRIKLEEEDGAVYDLSWKRIAPGHYSLSKDLQEGILIKGAIQAGGYALPFGPMIVGASTEWAFDAERVAELKALSVQTNGNELTDISKAWIRPEVSKQKNLLLPLGIAILLLALLEALVTRTGYKFSLPSFKRAEPALAQVTPDPIKPGFTSIAGRVGYSRKAKAAKQQEDTPQPEKPKPTLPPAEPKKEKVVSRSERFAKAKKRK